MQMSDQVPMQAQVYKAGAGRQPHSYPIANGCMSSVLKLQSLVKPSMSFVVW